MSGSKPFICFLLALTALSCQRFAHRFASVQTVCGVPPAADTHYLEFYSSQGQRLNKGDIIVDRDLEITEKGCLVWADSSPIQTLVIRHRLFSEGLTLRTQDLGGEGALVPFSLQASRYNPPKLNCQNALTSNGDRLNLFEAPAGLLASAYRTDLESHPTSNVQIEGTVAQLSIQDWADGSYKIAGSMTELYSPEQRRYPFACELTLDRRPPQFSFTRTLRAASEWVAAPGQVVQFPLDGDDADTQIAVCIQNGDEPCRFQTLADGRWVAPGRGIFQLQVKAIDRAGNESDAVPLSIRVYDATKIAGIRSELELIHRLLAEQNGIAAREHMRATLKEYAELGTKEETGTVRKALDEALFAVYLSPMQVRFPKIEGTFINWLTSGGDNLLLFQSAGFLVLRGETGEERLRWPVENGARISSRACVEGHERQLLLKIGKDTVRVTTERLEPVSGTLDISELVAAGSCRYRKYRKPGDVSWTMLDLLEPSKTYAVADENVWVLTPMGRAPMLLTLNAGVYATQNLDGSDRREHFNLNLLAVDKILPDGRLIMTKKDGTRPTVEALVFHYKTDSFVLETTGPLVNSSDSASNRTGGLKTLYRALTDSQPAWYVHDAMQPNLFRKIDLPTAVDPEMIQIGRDIWVSDASLVPGLLDLNVYNSQGTLLSTLRFGNGQISRPTLAGVMGNRLLIHGDDELVVFDPWPHTSLRDVRSNSRLGMQWGDGSYRFGKAPIQTHEVSLQMETLTTPGRTQTFYEPAGPTKAMNRLVEKPLLLWTHDVWLRGPETVAAFIKNQKSIVIFEADGSMRDLAVPEAGELLRLDISSDGRSLLILNRLGQVFKKSWLE
ncbi:MAG: hypothetical protein M3Q07_12995, partial [Pseudobdellovibrionaceae bacterium]|nr:hypothetical protein [Pseudobdellovibrionaceae bacterium]